MKAVLLATLLAAASMAQAQTNATPEMKHDGSMSMTKMQSQGSVSAPKEISVQKCWIRLLPGTVPSAAYFVVKNSGASSTTLTGVRTDAFGRAMLHQTRKDKQGMTGMSMVHNVPVPAKGRLVFAPGGYHVMLEKPTRPLQVGSTIPLTLRFAGNQDLTTECEVRSPGAMAN